jgi:hypothetical protein
MLAVGFLGPVAAFLIPVIAYVAVWVVDRYRWRALLINLASSRRRRSWRSGLPGRRPADKSAAFIALLAAVATATMALNYVIAPVLFALLDGQPILRTIRGAATTFPAVLLNVALLAVVAGIYAELGLLALVFVLLNVIAFTYMARLVITAASARASTRTSPGACSRGSSARSTSATRAPPATAPRWPPSRATSPATCGCPRRTRSSRTPAGLLHDIGKFVLSDRVMERGGQLEESDWRGIRRHPDIGAELLRDIGVYGPVAEIVRAHHERMDGRGYPRGLSATRSRPSRASSRSPRSTTRSPRPTPIARR